MARTTIVKCFDDLDGTEGAKTVPFSLDGTSFEIDLGPRNAENLRTALAPYIQAGVKAGRTVPVAPPKARAAGTGTAVQQRAENERIRAWAARKGFEVAPRGRIKGEIVSQYHADQRRAAEPTPAPASPVVAVAGQPRATRGRRPAKSAPAEQAARTGGRRRSNA